MNSNIYIENFSEIGIKDISKVGGKNASLGEMIGALKPKGINVPDGFATTVDLYNAFIKQNQLQDTITENLALYDDKKISLQEAGSIIRIKIATSNFSDELKKPIIDAYRKLSDENNEAAINVAVRSSATAEDLPDSSFAGQQESFLNIHGEDALLTSIKACFASLFTDRAIYYRQQHGFDHSKVYLSIGIQKMIRSDKGSSGVMFTLDTDTGFPNLILINANWGLGESVVGGFTDPDEYRIYKPFLSQSGLKTII
jgi:pyruvate,water dikinase